MHGSSVGVGAGAGAVGAEAVGVLVVGMVVGVVVAEEGAWDVVRADDGLRRKGTLKEKKRRKGRQGKVAYHPSPVQLLLSVKVAP